MIKLARHPTYLTTWLLATLITGVFLTAVVTRVRAQVIPLDQDAAVTLTAIPPRLGDEGELKLKPGQKKQVSLRVKNSSTQTIQIRTIAEDFIIDEDGTTPTPISENVSNRWSLASWLTITPSSQVLKPQETVGVSILIEVPEDALPGGHYAMVTHQPTSGQYLFQGLGQDTTTVPESEGASGINQRVGSLLYVVVDGAINEEAFIRDFRFPNFTEMGPVPYRFTVENMSDVHIKPKFGLEIFDVLGRRVDSIQPSVKNVFPLASREFTGQWERTWGMGYYTAKLTMSFGETGQVVIAKTAFWLFPLKIALSILIVLLVLIALGISVSRRRRRPQSANQEQSIKSDV